jgi:hypothetical protein
MNTKNEPCSICEKYMDGIACDEHECPVALMKAEIEMLESEIDKQYEQAKADILGNMADGGTSCHWCMEQHKAEAIKEFAERLVAIYENDEIYAKPIAHILVMTLFRDIDNLAKEMGGDVK